MSFRFRFILYFVLLEVFFIIIIVGMNFLTINNLSKELNNETIKNNITFLEELIKVPLSIHDIATLDDILENYGLLDSVNTIIVLDNNKKILSYNYEYEYYNIEELLREREDIDDHIDKEKYIIKDFKIFNENIYLGEVLLVFDISRRMEFISKNKHLSLFLIVLEIIISSILAYIIGNKLTTKLTTLSEVALQIGKNKKISIPFKSENNEIGILSNSMNSMQKGIYKRDKDLKRLSSSLLRQKEYLLKSNRYKDDFLSNISHELKTPLNAALLISSVLLKNRDNTLNKETLRNLAIVKMCIQDLAYLINDILDVTKLQSKKLKIRNNKVNLYKMAQELQEMFTIEIESKGLDFYCLFDDKIGYINSDVLRVKQIIKNIISNAIKFTKKGSITFELKDDLDYINFIIKDTGCGIAKGKIDIIFNRFNQLDISLNKSNEGLGLGLFISKKLVTLLNGKISLISEINIGTKVTISVPKNIS